MKQILFFLCATMLLASCDRVDSSKINSNLRDKVLKDTIINACYKIYPPNCIKDSTGKLHGIFVETLEQAAKDLGLSVKWEAEVDYQTVIADLNANKFDIFGGSVWANPKRAKSAFFSTPLSYSKLYVYSRANDNRFDKMTSYDQLNDDKYIFALIQGGTGEGIRKNMFKNSRSHSIDAKSSFSVSFVDIVANKADLVIAEPYQANLYLKANPGTIKQIGIINPITVYGNCYMFNSGEIEFEHMLNAELQSLINSGFVDDLIKKYEDVPNSFGRPAKSFSTN